MGFSYDEFMDMTWREFDYYSAGYERRVERQWDYTRHIIAASFNSSGFSKKTVRATDVFKLPHLDKVKHRKVNRMSDERLRKLLQAANINEYKN